MKLTREKPNRLNHLILVVGYVSRQAAGQEDANELIKEDKSQYKKLIQIQMNPWRFEFRWPGSCTFVCGRCIDKFNSLESLYRGFILLVISTQAVWEAISIHVPLCMNLSSVQGWNANSVLSLQLNWCLRPGKGCEDTTTGYCKSKSHIKVIGPDVGSPTEDVRCSEMKTEDTWKNAIPNEIPAMIPRLASMTLVTSVKQPWKQTNPKISGKLFFVFCFFFYSTWKVCDLRSSGSRQRTHRCVHLCGSLVVVFQSLRWTLGGISATAGGEAFLFKVRRLTPVCEVFHPAAMQLNREQSQKSTGFPPPPQINEEHT